MERSDTFFYGQSSATIFERRRGFANTTREMGWEEQHNRCFSFQFDLLLGVRCEFSSLINSNVMIYNGKVR
jgi:hypothetical protein